MVQTQEWYESILLFVRWYWDYDNLGWVQSQISYESKCDVGHESALQGYTGPGTTWANEINLGLNHVPGAGSITWPVDLTCSLAHYHCTTAAPYPSRKTVTSWEVTTGLVPLSKRCKINEFQNNTRQKQWLISSGIMYMLDKVHIVGEKISLLC